MFEKLKELYQYKEIIFTLANREIKSRYKQSIIGSLWAIIQPFSLMLIFSIIFGYFFKVDSNSSVPYPVFFYTVLVPWTFFVRSLTNSSTCLVGNRLLVTKIYFPKEILPLSLILANFVDLIIASVILLGMLIFYKVGFSLYFLYVIPLFFIQFIFTTALSLFLSSANVFFRDIANAISLILQIWMYATPIIYSVKSVPEKYLSLYMILNPMSPIMEGYRNAVLDKVHPDLFYTSIAFITSSVLLILTYIYFKKAEIRFSDVI